MNTADATEHRAGDSPPGLSQSNSVSEHASHRNQNVAADGGAGRRSWRTFTWRKLGILFALVAAFSTCFLCWQKVIKPRVFPKRFGVVLPGQIYRSGQISKWLIEETLVENEISVVIDLNGIESDDPHQQKEIEVIRRLGITLYRFPLRGDGTGDIRNYARAVKTLHECEQSGKKVLIHCGAGAQRTGGVVAAYRVLVLGHRAHSAYDELAEYKWNPKTDQRLLTFLNGHMAELADLLVEMKVIDKAPSPPPIVGPKPEA